MQAETVPTWGQIEMTYTGTIRRQKAHLWWHFSSSLLSYWPLGLYNPLGALCICVSVIVWDLQTRASEQACPFVLRARERRSLTPASKHSKQRPSWLPVSSKCSLSKKFSGQWLKWHHASSWNPSRDKNQVIQFTKRECSLLLPAFRGCWLSKLSGKRRAYLNWGFEDIS